MKYTSHHHEPASRGTGFGHLWRRSKALTALTLLLAAGGSESWANVIQANKTYPPPNGSFRRPGPAYNFGSGGTAVQLKDVAFTFFDNFTLVAGPVGTLSFSAQCSHRISTDGGTTWSGEQAATASFVVSLGAPSGNNYPFAITTLTISGGDLPATFQLRKSAGPLPASPVVTFTPNTPSPGLFTIDNTFYLPLELSQDSGATWTPHTVNGTHGTPAFALEPLTSEEVSSSPTLPPGDGEYYDAAAYHAKFAAGIVIRNPIHNGFIGQSCTNSNNPSGVVGQGNSLCPPPLLGTTQTEDFSSQMTFDIETPGSTRVTIGAAVKTRVHHLQDHGGLEIYLTQMLQLDPNPGSLPPGMGLRINPDPNKKSRGITTIRPGPTPTTTNIASAFALRLQLTMDNGLTWMDSDQFAHMGLRIQPCSTSYTVAATAGFNFLVNQLDHGSNTVTDVLTGLPDGASVMKWNKATQSYDAANNFMNGTWDNPAMMLSVGEGFILNLPAPQTVTFTGCRRAVEYLPAPTSDHILVGAQTPAPARYEDIFGVSPLGCTVLSRWNGSGFDQYTYSDGTWSPSEPVLGVGESAFVRRVIQNVDPAISCPSNIVVPSTSSNGAVVKFPQPHVTIGCGDRNGIVCTPPSGSLFPIGANTVTCTLVDDFGRVAECSFTVRVLPGYEIHIRERLNLIANHLDHGSNTLRELMPNVPGGTVFYWWDHGSNKFRIAIFDEIDLVWKPDNLTLNPGEGAYLRSPTAFNLWLSGTPHVPVLPVDLQPAHKYLLSRQEPLNGSTPEDITGATFSGGAMAYTYTGVHNAFTFDEFDLLWSPGTPIANIGEAMWIMPTGGTPPPLFTCTAAPTITCSNQVTVSCSPATGTPVTLSAAVFDADGDVLTVEWKEGTQWSQGQTTFSGHVSCTRTLLPGTHTITIKVTDSCGSTTTCTQTVTVVNGMALSVERAVIIRWSCPGVLQGAEDVNGPYTDIPGATSPYCSPASNPNKFFRVR